MNEDILKISLPKPDEVLKENLKRKMDSKTKPLGSLGRLEDAAVKIGSIFGTETPEILNPTALIFASDHGIAEEGISAYPQEVTYQMVMNFLRGGAAVNVLCRENGIRLVLTDSGVRFKFAPDP
ncbi:MAG TPA: nicotinate-nucleotide--dimethylbenzimidazole phosphoribosyltransferase, partial [Leptospiraceae bacterium]|nr:nicotinate-nucleotide--dimethylbenzimidazole phosphoribosyltransferase [Leptospiraceae bacterium]